MHTWRVLELHQKCVVFVPNYLLPLVNYRILFFSELSFQSLAYCRLSSTSPMIWSLYDKEWYGDVMSRLVRVFSIVSIMGVLSNNHVVPACP